MKRATPRLPRPNPASVRAALRWLCEPQLGLMVLGWIAAGSLTWTLLLGVEALALLPGGAGAGGAWHPGLWFHLAGRALLLTLLCSLPLPVLHILTHSPTGSLRRRMGLGILAAFVVGVYPAVKYARLLSEALAERAGLGPVPASLLFVALALGIVLLLVALYLWHWWGVASLGAEHGQSPRPAWYLTGLGVAATLLVLLSGSSEHDLPGVALLAAAAWFAATSLHFVLVVPVRGVLWGTVVVMALLGAGALLGDGPSSDAAATLRRRSVLNRGTAALVAPEQPADARLDIAGAGTWRCPESKPSAGMRTGVRARHVILVSLDGLRPDVLPWLRSGAAASKPRVAPRLAHFAAQSLHFERAVSTYPGSLLALGSALTGLAASQLVLASSVPDNLFTRARHSFGARFVTLPRTRLFRSRAARTLLVQSATKQEGSGPRTEWFMRQFEQGAAAGKRVLGWIHYHLPHSGPRKPYLAQLGRIDRVFGQLVDFLDKSGQLRDSLVIVFSDHGRTFKDQSDAGSRLGAALIDALLLVRAPGVTPGRSFVQADSSDIAATVLDVAGLAQASASAARSLFAKPRAKRQSVSERFQLPPARLQRFVRTPVSNPRQLWARLARLQQATPKGEPQVAIVGDRYRLVAGRASGRMQLFERLSGPGQHHTRLAAEPAIALRLRQSLRTWHQRVSRRVYCRVADGSRADH